MLVNQCLARHGSSEYIINALLDYMRACSTHAVIQISVVDVYSIEAARDVRLASTYCRSRRVTLHQKRRCDEHAVPWSGPGGATSLLLLDLGIQWKACLLPQFAQ